MAPHHPIPTDDLPRHPAVRLYLETTAEGLRLRAVGQPPEDFALTISSFVQLGARTAEALGLGPCTEVEVESPNEVARFGWRGPAVQFGAVYSSGPNRQEGGA